MKLSIHDRDEPPLALNNAISQPPNHIITTTPSSSFTNNGAQQSNTPELPLEIIELIIDELAALNDKPSLRNFALVSHAFITRCQTKLFHTIDLGDRCIPGELYYHRLLHILSQRPNFKSYIRDLRLVDSYVWDTKTDPGWLASEISMCDLLDQLVNLRCFSLTFNTGKPKWNIIKPQIRNSLMTLAKREGIQSFSLGHIHCFPPTHLVALTSIKHLSLVDLAIPPAELSSELDVLLGLTVNSTIPGVLPQPYPLLNCRVETLSISDPSPTTAYALSRIFNAQDQPSLKSLHVALLGEARPDLVHSLWEILKWSAGCLRHLEWRTAIRPSTPALRPPSPIDLSILRILQSLHFVVNFHSSVNPVFTELLSMLRQIESREHFEEIWIECMFLNTAELVACGSDWAVLDGVLSDVVGWGEPGRGDGLPTASLLHGNGHMIIPNGFGHAMLNGNDTPNGNSHYTPNTGTGAQLHITSPPHYVNPFASSSSSSPFGLSSSSSYLTSTSSLRFPNLHTITFNARIKTVRGVKLKESARAILEEQLPGCRRRGMVVRVGFDCG